MPTGLSGIQTSRRGALAAAASVLASSFALTACEAGPPPGELAGPTTEVADLVERSSDLVIGGRRLNAGLLRGFYSRRGNQPVWTNLPEKAEPLFQAVLRAREHGLDPALFHADVLRSGPGLSTSEREVLLSDSFLAYGDALARGAVPPERRRDDQTLSPDPVDVAATLDQAAASDDPAAVLEALAPTTPAYRALRQMLARSRGKAPAGPAAPAGRVRAIEVNLERQRWLPRQLPPDRVWVNVADERLSVFRAGRPAFSTRVVVGEDVQKNQSPEFRTTINASFYNPPWVIPADIARAEILPRLTRDPDYLTRNKMVLLANDEIEQLPGPEAGLGYIMFDMPNRFDVYLHDTPDRLIFNRENRRISHGCIRVEHPRELAALLMDQPLEAIDRGIAEGSTTRNVLPAPVPVYVVYETAFLGDDDTLQFRPDFYRRDASVWELLQPAHRAA